VRFLLLLFLVLFLGSCSKEEDRIVVLLTGKGRLQKLEGFKKGLKDLGIKNIPGNIRELKNVIAR